MYTEIESSLEFTDNPMYRNKAQSVKSPKNEGNAQRTPDLTKTEGKAGSGNIYPVTDTEVIESLNPM
jgi:hypothetical protein